MAPSAATEDVEAAAAVAAVADQSGYCSVYGNIMFFDVFLAQFVSDISLANRQCRTAVFKT
jgi:hypothetical protein